MAKIEQNATYMEGQWAAKKLIPVVEKTEFKTLEGAIVRKTTLIGLFEKDFGFSREMDSFDYNYAFNMGMLGEFTAAHKLETDE
jgi:hypothetical protein